MDHSTYRGDTALIGAAYYNRLRRTRATFSLAVCIVCSCGQLQSCGAVTVHDKPQLQVIVAKLLAANVDVDVQDREGQTALVHANNACIEELAERLVELMTNPNHVATRDSTALKLACWLGYETVVSKLVATHVEVNYNHTPDVTWAELNCACYYGHVGIVRKLLAAGVNVHYVKCNGCTALLGAAQEGEKAIVELLLDAGVDVSHTENDSDIALTCAAYSGHSRVVETLVACGSIVGHTNLNGANALMVALERGHQETTRVCSCLRPTSSIMSTIVDARHWHLLPSKALAMSWANT